MAAPSVLPSGFAALEPFVATWAVDRAAKRAALRIDSDADDRQAFYAAAVSLLPEALAYLNARPLAEFSDGERCLMQLMLSLAHVSLAVEIQGKDEAAHSQNARHVRILSATSEKDG
jgi:hypothetical protein